MIYTKNISVIPAANPDEKINQSGKKLGEANVSLKKIIGQYTKSKSIFLTVENFNQKVYYYHILIQSNQEVHYFSIQRNYEYYQPLFLQDKGQQDIYKYGHRFRHSKYISCSRVY